MPASQTKAFYSIHKYKQNYNYFGDDHLFVPALLVRVLGTLSTGRWWWAWFAIFLAAGFFGGFKWIKEKYYPL